MLVHVVDGARKPLTAADLLIRLLDGNQKQVHSSFPKSPTILFRDLPFADNLADNYTVIASARGYLQAGFSPVRISPKVLQTVSLMLLPREGQFNFHQARWETLQATDPRLAGLLARGAPNQTAARDRYTQLMEDRPGTLAGLLNLFTAMASIALPVGSPVDYFKELIWDSSMAEDRFFAWADQALVDQVKLAAAQGVFKPEIGSGFFHPGATSSYKQVQFGEANVQLTFHESQRATIDGVDCIQVEPDIDYYRDPGAHTLLEVLPNFATGGKTDPRVVYALRWIAGRRAGVPEFNPPYTIEAV
jgi:hypothetical protein